MKYFEPSHLKTTLHLYNLHSIAHVAQCEIEFHIWLLSAEKFVLCQHMQAAVLGDQSKALACHFPSAKKVQEFSREAKNRLCSGGKPMSVQLPDYDP